MNIFNFNMFQLDEVRLPLKSRHFYLNDTIYGDRIEAYKKYIQDIIDLIAYDAGLRRLPPDQLMAQLDEIVDFERKLANVKES